MEEVELEMEAEAFAVDMFNYVFQRRIYKQTIPVFEKECRTVDHFNSKIGEAVMLMCCTHRKTFSERFLFDYPDYLDDMPTFTSYCSRFALELYNEEKVIDSLLMFSAMIIELVIYCLNPYGKDYYINYLVKCWSSIFIKQFADAFFASGGWKALLDISHIKANIYEEIKQKYPSNSNKDIPFHYWIDSMDQMDANPEKFALEAGYSRIRDRMQQLLKFDSQHKSRFDEIIESSESEPEDDVMQQKIYAPSSDYSTEEAFVCFKRLSLHENKDLEKEISEKREISELVSTSMEVDSNIPKPTPEEESRELGAIPKIYLKTESCQTVEKVVAADSPITDEDIKMFTDIVFYGSDITGVYIINLFADNEKKRILTNDVSYSRLIKDTIQNPSKKPDVEKLTEDARRIIKESSSAKLFENKLLETEPDIIPFGSSENVEQNMDEPNLLMTYEKENLPLAEKALQPTEEMEIQHGGSPNRSRCPSLDNFSPRKMCEIKSTLSDIISLASDEIPIENPLRTLKTKPQKTSQIKENRNEQCSVIRPKYIKEVLQHLNNKLHTRFSVSNPVNLDLDFPYSKHDTSMMMELLNFSHTVLDKIRNTLEIIPICTLTEELESNLKDLIAGREGTRSAMKTLGHSLSTPLEELSKYHMEIVKVLISECAYFLRLQDKLKRVAEKLEKDGACTRPKKSRAKNFLKKSPQPSIDNKNLPKISSEADNRKRRKYPTQKSELSSKQGVVNVPYSSTSTAEDASNSPICNPKRPRLPTEDAGSPVQMAESSLWVENVTQSSDSEENKY